MCLVVFGIGGICIVAARRAAGSCSGTDGSAGRPSSVSAATEARTAANSHGDLIPNLKKENFRVLDEGVPQAITNFAPTEAPITTVLLLEFSSRGYYELFAYIGKYWSTALFPQLQQKDWVALETFDMKTRIEVDFTQDKEEVLQAISRLYFPGFSESNVFDALELCPEGNAGHESSAGSKPAQDFFPGNWRLRLVSSIRGRDA